MLYVFLMFLAAVAVTVYAVRSPAFRVQAVEGWQALRHTATVKLAALAGTLGLLPSLAEQVQAILPQIQATPGLELLQPLLASQGYRTFVALLTLYIIVARGIRLPPKASP